MSDSARGPLIQRQGYIKRAPSGKLSAFKRWEKKWCVFALSKRNGPVLDFFDDRSAIGNGPAGAIGRVELKNTKQVCAAIQCKVPHTFIIVTDSKIVSLAALSQTDAESWISCMRRVLTNEGCLQSSEDHTYEVSGNAITRQEQERLSRTRRRPPTPPGSGSDEGSSPRGSYPSEVAPPPPTRPPPATIPAATASSAPSSSAPPMLPKRTSHKKGALPPPVPTSSRPKLASDNDSKPKRSSSLNERTKNVLEVLMNYEESTDTTYEAGDRQAIRNAASTLDPSRLARALQDYKDSESPSHTEAAAAAPVYSRINKQKEEDRHRRPPVAPRRVNTIQPRIEHDFSPQLATKDVDSGTESSDSEEDMDAVVRELEQSRMNRDLDAIGDDAEDAYACMDAIFDDMGDNHNLDALAVAVDNRDSDDDDDDRYVEGPIIKSSAGSGGVPSPLPTTPVTEQLPLPPKEHKSPQAAVSAALLTVDIDNNIYENSKTVLPSNGLTPKAVPFAAPRRAKSVSASLSARVSPPKPTARKIGPQASFDDQDNYENFLGEFGHGVSIHTNPRTKNKTAVNDTPKVVSKLSRLHIGHKQQSCDNIPLPKTPDDMDNPSPLPSHSNDTYACPPSASRSPPLPRPPAIAALTDLNIPVADGESSCSSLASPDAAATKPAADSNTGRDPNHVRKQLEEEIRFQGDMTSIAGNSSSLPSEEAPPPYTPPRILNDSQHNPNMDCIVEGNSEDEDGPATSTNQTQSVSALPMASSTLLYDSHPAFDRPTQVAPRRASDKPTQAAPRRGSDRPTQMAQGSGSDRTTQVAPGRGTDAVEVDVKHNSQSASKPTNSAVANKYSPHTPPGTPPPFAQRKSVVSKPIKHMPSPQRDNSNLPSDEDVVIRLEDTFPKMQQHTTERPRCSYLEDVIAVSPTSTGSRYSKSPLKKSFSVLAPGFRTADRFLIDLNQPVPKAASIDALEPVALAEPVTPVAEYDHVIRQRVAKAQHRVVHTASSSDEDGSFVVQRRPKKLTESKQRRKSAPPNSLAVRSLMEMAAGAEGFRAEAQLPVRPPKEKPAKERRSRQPLDGGTLLREGKVFKAPQRDSKNVPLKQAQTELLQEEIGHSYGVKVTIWKKDVKYALFLDFMNYIWVVGWNQKERPLLQHIFHIGDKILSVNNEVYTSASKLSKLLKRSDSDTKFEFVLRRLPFGKAYFVHRNLDYEDIGIELKPDSAEVVKVAKGSLVGKQGLRVNPNRAFGSGQCHWVLTEVNHRPLNLLATDSEAHARLCAVGKDISFVVQPMDFVELLRKALKSTFGCKDYIVS